MQTLSWYGRRLCAMSAPEICWRIAARIRDLRDQCAAPRWFRPQPVRSLVSGGSWSLQECGWPEPLGPSDADIDGALQDASWRESLLQRAEAICDDRLSFLNLEDCDFGPVPRWNHDHESARAAPLQFAPAIDYRNPRLTGDAKLVWEPNRHQHLPLLARAWRISGQRRYAEKIVAHLGSWLDQCPCGFGMNWRSPLELAIRLINWVWALETIRPAGVVEPDFADRLLLGAVQHLREITRKYSRYSSANNHLIGEAAGVFVASTFFHVLRESASWARESRRILTEQMRRQVHPDGGDVELATAYHLFVLEFFTLAALRGRQAGLDFPPDFYARLEGMYEFVAALAEAGPVPQFGDGDDGCVLALGHPRDRAAEWLEVGGTLFNRPSLVGPGQASSGEAAFWLLGSSEFRVPSSECHAGRSRARALQSRAFPDSGYFLLQHGVAGAADALSVTFDCGALGMGSIAAHGHADCLSFTLRAFGTDVLVDPGTYDYFTWPAWRDYFRSTRAHNTVEIDGLDQSEMLGPFLWGRRAKCRCLLWEPTPQGGTISAEHDGYVPSCGVTHRRTLKLCGGSGRIDVLDQLRAGPNTRATAAGQGPPGVSGRALGGRGGHRAALCFHLAPTCSIEPDGPGSWVIDCGRGRLRLALDPRLQVRTYFASTQPIAGWVSPGYHRRMPAMTLVGECEWVDAIELSTLIEIVSSRQ